MGDVEDPDFDIEEVSSIQSHYWSIELCLCSDSLRSVVQVLKKGKERTAELTEKLKSMAG